MRRIVLFPNLVFALLAMGTLQIARAESPLILTCERARSTSGNSSLWDFRVKNASAKPVVIALAGAHFYTFYRERSEPIFLAQIRDFEGNPSTRDRFFEQLAKGESMQGAVLNPGESVPLTDMTFRVLPASIVAKFATHDGTWKETSVTWSNETAKVGTTP